MKRFIIGKIPADTGVFAGIFQRPPFDCRLKTFSFQRIFSEKTVIFKIFRFVVFSTICFGKNICRRFFGKL